jgi:single-stranded DNA-specific DHH superfamily exonuclease
VNPAVAEAWCQACAEQLASAPLQEQAGLADVRLDAPDDMASVLADLERLKPCGEANRAPKLLVGQVRVVSARVVGGEHLKLSLANGAAGVLHAPRHDMRRAIGERDRAGAHEAGED